MTYKVILIREALKDIERFRKSGEKMVLKKMDILLEELKDHPYTGVPVNPSL